MTFPTPTLLADPGSAPASVAALKPLFAPYCAVADAWLEQGLQRLLSGQFQGQRPLRGASPHGYTLRWSEALAPLDEAHCRLTFAQPVAVEYAFVLPTHQLLAWLAAVPAAASDRDADLPDSFWRWLILGERSGA